MTLNATDGMSGDFDEPSGDFKVTAADGVEERTKRQTTSGANGADLLHCGEE